MNTPNERGYALIDTGQLMKIERFGEITLARPSSLCIWRKRLPQKSWDRADAVFDPERGWIFKGKQFETWRVNQAGCDLELRLQNNGQVGLFPEHSCYLPQLDSALAGMIASGLKPKMLNLFAYTGMATVFAASRGAEVCHVDMSKKALTWAAANLTLNGIQERKVRFICDDAVKFLEREIKRKSAYDILVVDPPSFSRVSKNQFWKLEEVIGGLLSSCLKVLNTKSGAIVATCHHPGLTCEMLANLLRDNVSINEGRLSKMEMGITEEGSGRVLSAGSMVMFERGAPAGPS